MPTAIFFVARAAVSLIRLTRIRRCRMEHASLQSAWHAPAAPWTANYALWSGLSAPMMSSISDQRNRWVTD